jgi:DNA (cytosine-5)-methyltransferase 1
VDTSKTITHLSLCSGYEGIGLGLRRVLPNLREIAYVEIEAFAIANLVAKMEAEQLDPAPIYTDLKTFPYGKFRGKVDILSGGFPCQPFSSAGKRKATDDPRHLFSFIADGIRKCQPRIVFLENVQGILSCKTGDGEPVLQYVLRELEQMGYRATAGIFSAEEVGAPHQRKRVFILGYSSSIRSREYREDTRETSQDSSREERRMYESKRTSALSKYGSQSQNSSELADNSSQRGTAGLSGQDEWQEGKPEKFNYCSHRWPSRPSQTQYEWEEQRITQSKLGRATDGTTCRVDATTNRVDRLRLLGNGVVNQTAAKAFVTLIQRLT